MIEKDKDKKFELTPQENKELLPSHFVQSHFEHAEEKTHLRDYLEVILRRKRIITVFLLTTILTVAILSFIMTPLYKSTATVHIQTTTPNVLQFLEVFKLESAKKEFFETQYTILKSRNIAEKVIKRLSIEKEPKYFFNNILQKFHIFRKDNANIEKNQGNITKKSSNNDLMGIGSFLSRLEITPVKKSEIVKISFFSHIPEIAAKATNAVIEEYKQFTLNSQINPTQESQQRIEKEIEPMRKKLEESDKKLKEYSAENKIIFLQEGRDSVNLTTQKISNLSEELDNATAERIKKEALYQEAKEAGVNSTAVLENPEIKAIRREYIQLDNEYSKLSRLYEPEHPKLLILKEQIDKLAFDKRIQREAEKIIKAKESDYKTAIKREKFLANTITKLHKEYTDFPQKMVQYEVLKREVDTNRELYNNLIQRFKEVSVSASFAASNIEVIDPAMVSGTPYKPKKGFNFLLSLIGGLFGGVLLAFFVEYFDNTIKDADEVEKKANLPFLGAIPLSEGDTEKFIRIGTFENDQLTEAFKSISTYLQFSTASQPPKTILITSPLKGEGKTTVAVNTAISLTSFLGKGVIVDADLRKPNVHNFFSLDNSKGLSSFLSGNIEFEKLIKKFPYLNLDIIPGGPVPPNPPELLNSSRMNEFIDALSGIYDFIIVDAPPVLGLSDSPILASFVEGVVVVTRANITPVDALLQTKKSLNVVHAKILGVICNGLAKKSFRHYYQYHLESKKIKEKQI
jgi:capsular exopolysaccharide synthesis family protein